MQAHALKQTDLAEVLEVPLDRVKSLTSGKVKNLKREESELLIGKLGIRAQWLVTGDGPMHEDSETQDEFVARTQAMSRMHALIQAMPLRELTKMRLSALVSGDPAHDGPLIAQALMQEAQGVDFVTSQRIEGLPPMTMSQSMSPVLPPRKQALLDNYDAADETGKRHIERAADLEAQSGNRKAARGGQ